MTASLSDYVKKILMEIDGSKNEKDDLYEELMTHLQLSSEDWQQKGLSKQEANERAIIQFGKHDEVGTAIQSAMYPLRKTLLTSLAIISLLYSYATYLIELFAEGDAHYSWLIISVISSSLLLMFSLQVFPALDRKVLINSILILHAFVYVIGAGFSSPLVIVSWLIVITSIVLIYRTTIIDYQFDTMKNRKLIKFFHFYNITIMLMLTTVTLYIVWLLLIFSEFEFMMLLVFTPLIVCLIAYYVQMIFLYKGYTKTAITIAVLPFMIMIVIVIFILYFYYPGIIGVGR